MVVITSDRTEIREELDDRKEENREGHHVVGFHGGRDKRDGIDMGCSDLQVFSIWLCHPYIALASFVKNNNLLKKKERKNISIAVDFFPF